jgi:phosphate transport system permease protein
VPRGALKHARRKAGTRTDQRAERTLGALALTVLVLVGAMVVTVFVKAWPSFSHNGLGWFGPGGDVDEQLRAMQQATPLRGHSLYYFHGWSLLWGTLLTTLLAVVIALVVSLLAAIFLTEFAPAPMRRTLDPVVRLLAGVPSVIYGLIGILAIAPWIGNNLISDARRRSVGYVVQLSGANLATATVILAVMITPIMVALIAGALASVPTPWREGSVALGVNRWRTVVRVSLRTARPAIVAATVLATARALGEAIMISMVSGSRSFAPKPIDGLTFLFEPLRTLASAIVDYHEGINAPALGSALYGFAFLLLFSAFALSVAGYLIKLPLRKYQVRG